MGSNQAVFKSWKPRNSLKTLEIFLELRTRLTTEANEEERHEGKSIRKTNLC
jgi:hypothetical protein